MLDEDQPPHRNGNTEEGKTMNEFPLKPPRRGFHEGSWTVQELHFQAIFREIQFCYFPGWKNGFMWRVRVNRHLPWFVDGYCRPNFFSIEINPNAVRIYSEFGIKLIFFHEAAHAVTTQRHGGQWFHRMKGIAARLKQEGETYMAQLLMLEADGHARRAEYEERGTPPPFQI